MSLTDSQLIEAREAFALFDRESSGSIRASEVEMVLRSLGYAVPPNVKKDVDPSGSGQAKIGDFLRCVEKAAALSAASNQAASRTIPLLASGANYLFHECSANGRSRSKSPGKSGPSSTSPKKDAHHPHSIRQPNNETVHVDDLKRLLTKSGERLSDDEVKELLRELHIADGKKVHTKDLISLLTSV